VSASVRRLLGGGGVGSPALNPPLPGASLPSDTAVHES